jgi:hypothetical protein
MAIRTVRVKPDLPPAHLYLEDVEGIVEVMVANREPWDDETKAICFVVGRRECDSFDDLRDIGGKWREFEAEVGSRRFAVSSYGVSAHGPSPIFDYVLGVMSARRSRVREVIHAIPGWGIAVLGWVISLTVGLLVNPKAHPALAASVAVSIFVVFIAFIVWTTRIHTIVELRYSHGRTSKAEVLTAWISKLVWLVVGSILTLLIPWLWHRFVGP